MLFDKYGRLILDRIVRFEIRSMTINSVFIFFIEFEIDEK